jgi:hypothetical protein
VIKTDRIDEYLSKCRNNADSIEIAIEAIRKDLITTNFPNWNWDIILRGTLQNKPYLCLSGSYHNPQKYSEYASITIKCSCCNKQHKSAFRIEAIQPILNRYHLEYANQKYYDDSLRDIIGLSYDKLTTDIPTICKILTETKTENDLGYCKTQFGSIIKQQKLKKDF